MDYLTQISTLPSPAQHQIERFTAHLLQVHSWYKHLPLMEGGVFTVFLEPDLDRVYPIQHPKLPFGNSQSGYLEAFGHLAYQYTIEGTTYQDFDNKIVNGIRVQTGPTAIPERLKTTWSFVLYPYCHPEFAEGISLFEKELQQLATHESSHPQENLLRNWHTNHQEQNEIWENRLNESEREAIISQYDWSHTESAEPLSDRCAHFLKLENEAKSIETALQKAEQAKVEVAIGRLIESTQSLKTTSDQKAPQ
jgi:hypothetical protein